MVEQNTAALQAARERMIQKRFGGEVPKAGGMRRKKKAVHKAASSDDKKIVSTLKRLNVSTIPAIEEINMFKDNGEVRIPFVFLLFTPPHSSPKRIYFSCF